MLGRKEKKDWMREFDYSKLADRTWDNEIISYISKIHEYKGKQELFLRQKTVELERLIEIAKIQSTEASNRIEGIITTGARLKQLVADKPPRKTETKKKYWGIEMFLIMSMRTMICCLLGAIIFFRCTGIC